MSGAISKEDKELIDRLIKSGLQKNVAKTLVYIASKDETKSREIESEMGLRQPEVSIAMQIIRDRGWVTKRDIKKEGKGRPVHAYSLKYDFEDIISEIEEEQKEKIEEIEENLEKMKDLIEDLE